MSGAVRIIARDRSDLLGEGPMWSARERALLWVDILGRKVQLRSTCIVFSEELTYL